MTQEKQMTNPLGTDRISTLVARFAVPSIIAMLVSAVYNIADQLFIGNAVMRRPRRLPALRRALHLRHKVAAALPE